jgi:hypothetical protein
MDNQKTAHNSLTRVLISIAIAVMSGLTIYPWPAEAQCSGNDPAAPCFAQNNDILGGQRSLLPDDDLVVNVWAKSSGSDSVDEFHLNTSQLNIFQYSNHTHDLGSCDPGGLSAAQSVIGRVFSLPNDMLVNARPTSDCKDVNLQIVDQQNDNNSSNLSLGLGSSAHVALAMADFNLDGYQDIFFIDPDFAQVFSAKCTNDPFAPCTGTAGNAISDGLAAGPRHSVNTPWYASPPVTGDFNGDGIIDVAWSTYDANLNIQVRFMSVCPAANVTVLGKTCTQPFEIIDASTHISTGGTVNQNSARPRPYIALTANNFDGSVDATTGIADAELLVALVSSDNKSAALSVYDFDANLSPSQKSTTTVSDLYEDSDNTLPVFLASKQLDPLSARPEAVFGATKKGGSVEHRGLLSVITFDASLNMTVNSVSLDTGENDHHKTRVFGLALGRFDPPDPSSSETDFYQQIAVLVDHENEATRVQIFTIPDDSASSSSQYSCSSSAALCLYTDYKVAGTVYYQQGVIQLAPLQAGDLQGRSLLLGAPEKVTVAQTQPDIVLGVPPMHVDFIAPPGGTAPQILNLSVFPSTFNTAYDFTETTGKESSRQASTSYSYSVKETVKGKVTWGSPLADSVTVKTKDSATEAHQHTVSNTFDTYSTRTDSFNSSTEFDDLVAATSQQMNIYSYPVIGQFVCPSNMPDCTDAQKEQLQVQYSAPDNIVYTLPTNAGSFEWYQPVTEPGNIFSYPGSLSLLKTAVSQQNPQTASSSDPIDLLTPEDELWESESTETVGVQWQNGGGASHSSGTVDTLTYDASVSVSGKASFVGGSASAGFGVDYNNSTSNTTLNTKTVTFTGSTGVALNRGLGPDGSADDQNLLYEGQTYIFGQPVPPGSIQTDLTVPTDYKTHGRIEVAHAADMVSTGFIQSGDWWKQAYTAAPDVSLNHPQRWLQKLPTSQNTQQVMFNCPIGFTSAFGTPTADPGACTSTNTQPNPVNVNDAAFYKMKGFFILPADATTGPTTTLATLGDTPTLRARVYNYSLANMPAGTTVHVRFYAQPWDATQGQFASGSGKYGFAPAVFIGETLLPPIPAFCGGSQGAVDSCLDSNAPPLNWTLAQVQWDTSTLNPLPTTVTNWKFWVVAWMENGGSLVSEIAQHGLKSIPAQNVASLAEVPVETYSNNLGFYNQVFTLELPTASAVAAVGADRPRLTLEAFEVPDTVLRDQLTTVRIHHHASGRAFDYVRTFLFEGDPLADGKLLDMDIIPRVPQDAPFLVPFQYQPRVCGARKLFVQAAPVDGGEIAEAAFDVTVTLDPQAQSQRLIEQVESLGLAAGIEKSLSAKLEAAKRSFRRGNTTAGLSQLNAFSAEVWAQSGKKVPTADATRMIAVVNDLGSCL